jgi:uncharacterized protein (DUF2252 family)
VVDAMRTYRERMAGYAAMRTLDLWYAHITAEDVRHATPAKLRDETARLERRGRARTAAALYPKVTQLADGRIRIEDDPPFLYHLDSRLEAYGRAAHQVFARYRATLPAERRVILDRFQPIDVAAKVVGVGSVGTRCYVILLLAADDDPLFLQMKEAHASVLEPFLGRSKSKNHGERVVFGQRVIQEASDVFLGWTRGPGGRDFYFRQLRDMRVPMDLEETTVDRLANFARLCGWALARAHAKSGDPALLAGYLGSSTAFDEALADYATAYADQVERDFEAFVRAARAGRLASDVDPARR